MSSNDPQLRENDIIVPLEGAGGKLKAHGQQSNSGARCKKGCCEDAHRKLGNTMKRSSSSWGSDSKSDRTPVCERCRHESNGTGAGSLGIGFQTRLAGGNEERNMTEIQSITPKIGSAAKTSCWLLVRHRAKRPTYFFDEHGTVPTERQLSPAAVTPTASSWIPKRVTFTGPNGNS